MRNRVVFEDRKLGAKRHLLKIIEVNLEAPDCTLLNGSLDRTSRCICDLPSRLAS